MPPLPELTPGRTCEFCLIGIEGHNLKIGANQEQIKLAASGIPQSIFNNHPSLEDGRSRYKPS